LIIKGKLINDHLLKTNNGYFKVLCPTSQLYLGEAYFVLEKTNYGLLIKDIVPIKT
jgi:hypothetical protein